MTEQVKRGIWKWLIPFLLSLLITVGCYFYWNARYTFGFGDNAIRKVSIVSDILWDENYDNDDVIAVNVSYDKALIPYYDEFGIPAGMIDITDRKKLGAFLDSLSRWDNYRYIVCDVAFDKRFASPYDDSLFSRIAAMQRIAIPSSGNDPEILAAKTAWSAFDQLYSWNGFMKYNYYSRDGEESLALRMYREIDGGDITPHTLRYSSGGHLCVSSLIPDIKYANTHVWNEDGTKEIWNLGADILDESYDLSPFFQDRIILIGDWLENDLHGSIRGKMAGCALIFNAYLALRNRDHLIRWWVIVILILAFYAEFIVLLRPFWRKTNNNDSQARKPHSSLYRFFKALVTAIISWLGYTGVLVLICRIIYITSGFFVNVAIIGSLLAFLSPFLKKKA